MKILMSIKPKYAEMIFNDTKRVEYRRILPKDIKKGDKIIIYESAPICRVVGSATVNYIEKECLLSRLWALTKGIGGVTEEEFHEYFKGKWCGNAIYFCFVEKFDVPKKLSEYGVKRPPQSFMYLKGVDYE